MYDSYQALGIESRGSALWLTLCNPKVNTITMPMHTELSRVFSDINRDKDVRCVVLTGAGETFSAGGDINWMREALDNRALWLQTMTEARQIVIGMLDCDKPIIGRINGHAMGLGATLAACCDITIMLDTAKIADSHVRVGLAAGDGGALLWPHLIGWGASKRYLLTGDALTGREAADVGLVTMATSRENFDETVDRWIEKFANGATQAICATKRALNITLRQQAEAYLDAHLGLETLTQLSNDHREAVNAFQEKRKPVFEGR